MLLCIANKSTRTADWPMPRGDSQRSTTDKINTMTLPADDRDDLIKELFTEAHGLRMKNEQISQYVETKIAELVKTRRELLQTRGGLEVLVEQRNKLQGQLDALASELVEQRNKLQGQIDALASELGQLIEINSGMTDQRDRLRMRIAAVEASRSYRIGQRLSRLAAKLSQQK